MAIDQRDPEAHTAAPRPNRWEQQLLARYTPELTASGVARYVHQYQGHSDSDQQLSVQMRELIATVVLASQGGIRFSASHIRGLYHLGVTSAVVVEAFWAVEPVFGRANCVRGIQALHLANDVSNTESTLPPGGEPKTLVDFPELHLGEGRPEVSATEPGLAARPEVAYVARIDPKLAEMAVAHHHLVYRDGGAQRPNAILPAPTLELLAIVALCVRGAIDEAAEHIQRVVRYGVTPRQIVEAISAAIPPTGQSTLWIGARAMMRAGIEP